MSNEMKLLQALCEALGFDVETVNDYKRQRVDKPIKFDSFQRLTRRMVTKPLSTSLYRNDDGSYETELIKPEITYTLTKRVDNE